MNKINLGQDSGSKNFWEANTSSYISALDRPYHEHRLQVIDSIIPKALYKPGNLILDFGCGNGVHLIPFL